jgi:uncharacterized membrane protein
VLVFTAYAGPLRRLLRDGRLDPLFCALNALLMTEPASPTLHEGALRATPKFSVIVGRNQAIASRSTLLAVSIAAAFAFVIGLGFASLGLWLVLPFVGLEIIALVIAFRVHSRHAADNETIRADERGLAVEIREGNRLFRYRLDANWAQCIHENAGREARLLIGSHGKFVQIGRHLNEEGRRKLRIELNQRLREHRMVRD